MTDRHFPSKVLLFGEYTALSGGNALAIPFSKFTGHWKQDAKLPTLQDEFIDHLKQINEKLTHTLNLPMLRQYLVNGWRFHSSIPWGKGLGSSAALCASIYQSITASKEKQFLDIRHDLSLIEAHFHGKSSGLDAVVSFTNSEVVLKNKNELTRVDIPTMTDHVYLYDSQIERETLPLVKWYQHRIELRDFKRTMDQLDSWNAQAITLLEKGKSALEVVNKISQIQFEYLTHLIPPTVNRIWKKTLDDRQTAVKLCGAGGGGYFLVVSSLSPGELVALYPKLSDQICTIK